MNTIRLRAPVYRQVRDKNFVNDDIWVLPGEYEIVREFDETRLMIRVKDKITLIRKELVEVK